jgi:hypothetical protein
MLRRAIPVEGGLTTGSWCKHGLREEEAGLGARWRHRWCAPVAGTATSASSRAAERCCCDCGRERGREGETPMKKETRCGRLEGRRARALEGAIGRHPAGVASMRPPRGARCLTRLGASVRGKGRRSAARRGPGPTGSELGRGSCAGEHSRSWAALASGLKARRRPVKARK